VEIAWFQFSFAGHDVRVPTSELSDADRVQPIVESYRQEVKRSNEIVAACSDLSQLSRRAIRTSDPMPLRWVLVHMIEETGRHAGHADILREQIDGVTGR
jgi:gluconate kinase